VPVPFGRDSAGSKAKRPRGDDQWATRTVKRLRERLDGATVGVCGALEVAGERDVVLERQVDDAVCSGRSIVETVKIIERATPHLYSCGGESSRRSIGTGQPDHLVAGANELGYDGGTDPARRPGDEDSHVRNLPFGNRSGYEAD
jgi:hypothetical protein